MPRNRVVSVVLRPGERVRWIWTAGPQGQYVSGYTIIKTRRSLIQALPVEEVLANYRTSQVRIAQTFAMVDIPIGGGFR